MPGGVKAMQGHQPVEEIAEEVVLFMFRGIVALITGIVINLDILEILRYVSLF